MYNIERGIIIPIIMESLHDHFRTTQWFQAYKLIYCI